MRESPHGHDKYGKEVGDIYSIWRSTNLKVHHSPVISYKHNFSCCVMILQFIICHRVCVVILTWRQAVFVIYDSMGRQGTFPLFLRLSTN